MAEIRWTDEAAIWLEDIYKYIAEDNPEAAARVAEGIYRKVQILAEFPEIGYRYRTETEGDISAFYLVPMLRVGTRVLGSRGYRVH